MRFLVTGANGYAGARLMKDLSRQYETYGTYHSKSLLDNLIQMDVTNKNEVLSVVRRVKPEVIVHAAAIPNQSKCDRDINLANKVNVGGTKNVAFAANDINAKIVLISTTAVLEPEKYGSYGKTKLEAENVVKEAHEEYLILRPGLIIGQSPNSKNDRFPNRLLNNITQGISAVYDNSEKMEVSWIGHLYEVIAEAEKKGIVGQTIPVVVDEYKTRFEIARDILQSFNVQVIPKGEPEPLKGVYATVDKLKELGMTVYTYQNIIGKTIQEIKEQVKTISGTI